MGSSKELNTTVAHGAGCGMHSDGADLLHMAQASVLDVDNFLREVPRQLLLRPMFPCVLVCVLAGNLSQ